MVVKATGGVIEAAYRHPTHAKVFVAGIIQWHIVCVRDRSGGILVGVESIAGKAHRRVQKQMFAHARRNL